MGRRGVPPKPAALRLMQGARPSKVNQAEPIPRSGRIVAPDHVSDYVREVFDFVVAELEHMKIGAPVDVHALVCYAEAVDKHRKASMELAETGTVLVKGLHGTMVRHPALAVQRDAANQIRQLAQEFGLTPSARARIDTSASRADDDADNPFAAHG